MQHSQAQQVHPGMNLGQGPGGMSQQGAGVGGGGSAGGGVPQGQQHPSNNHVFSHPLQGMGNPHPHMMAAMQQQSQQQQHLLQGGVSNAGPSSAVGSGMMSSGGGVGNSSTVVGSGAVGSTGHGDGDDLRSRIDMSDFPALGVRDNGRGISNNFPTPLSAAALVAQRANQVGDQQAMQVNGEFTINSEDFPALPGQSMPGMRPSDGEGNVGGPSSVGNMSNSQINNNPNNIMGMGHGGSSGMVIEGPDSRYGLMGLLSVIRMTEQDINMLSLGCDLTSLGLSLNSSESLYSSFTTPFPEFSKRSQSGESSAGGPGKSEPEYTLPQCYYVQATLQPPQMKLTLFSDETLFYAFYSMPRDVIQQAAANELYNRDWRYHKDLRLWFTRAPGTEPSVKTGTYERGIYIYFDPKTWQKIRKDFVLAYDQLEERKTAKLGVN
eukprot:Nk52_evm4s157 gene=Nk52_evmTU4s157